MNVTKFGQLNIYLFLVCLLRFNWHTINSTYLWHAVWYVLTNFWLTYTPVNPSVQSRYIMNKSIRPEFPMLQSNHSFLRFMPPAPLLSTGNELFASLSFSLYFLQVYNFAICLSSLVKYLPKSFVYFLFRGLVSYWVLRAPNVFYIQLFYQLCDFQAFSLSLCLDFSSS